MKKKFTPASKLLRTEGQAAAETGLVMATLALYPDQVDILNDASLHSVHLHGPPGTGKTVLLTLKASQWLHLGRHVHVVSVADSCRAVSLLIEKQLLHVLKDCGIPGRAGVSLHMYDILERDERNRAVQELVTASQDGQLFLIMDEVRDM